MSPRTVPDEDLSLSAIWQLTEQAEAPATGNAQWSPTRFRLANVIGAGVVTVFAGLTLVGSFSYPYRVGDQPGPGFFPAIIAVCLLVLGVAWFAGSLANKYKVDDEVEPPPDRSALIRAGITFAVITTTPFALAPLGYPITLAFAVAAFTLLGGGRWLTAVLVGLIFPTVTFLLVTTVLGLQLPTGILRPLLVGLL